MKQAIVIVLIAAFTSSCRCVQAQSPKKIQKGLALEQLLYKADLKEFKEAAFSSDGNRFLLTDNYNSIRIWQRPFEDFLRELNIQDELSITALQFCGNQMVWNPI